MKSGNNEASLLFQDDGLIRLQFHCHSKNFRPFHIAPTNKEFLAESIHSYSLSLLAQKEYLQMKDSLSNTIASTF